MTSTENSVGEQCSAPGNQAGHDGMDRLRRKLKAVIVLGGQVRKTALSVAVNRAIMDLPIDTEKTVLDLWHDQFEGLAKTIGLPNLPVQIMTNKGSHHPTVSKQSDCVTLEVKEDIADLRGTAGVLRDVIQDYDEANLVLVVNGAQIMCEPLTLIARDLAAQESDVALVSHEDGTPSGAALVRCGTLTKISPIGYVDLKEQALPKIARHHRVNVVTRDTASGIPIRTLADYIRVLRLHHQWQEGSERDDNVFAEDWQPTFGIVEPDAYVAPDARVHDSVVLRGGRVEDGAVLVQSVVCAGGTVRRNDMVTDQFVASASSDPKTSEAG